MIEASIFFLTSLKLVRVGLPSILLEYVERFNPNFKVEEGAVEGRSQGHSSSRSKCDGYPTFFLQGACFRFKTASLSIVHPESCTLVLLHIAGLHADHLTFISSFEARLPLFRPATLSHFCDLFTLCSSPCTLHSSFVAHRNSSARPLRFHKSDSKPQLHIIGLVALQFNTPFVHRSLTPLSSPQDPTQ